MSRLMRPSYTTTTTLHKHKSPPHGTATVPYSFLNFDWLDVCNVLARPHNSAPGSPGFLDCSSSFTVWDPCRHNIPVAVAVRRQQRSSSRSSSCGTCSYGNWSSCAAAGAGAGAAADGGGGGDGVGGVGGLLAADYAVSGSGSGSC